MRYPAGHKEDVRARIVEAASRALRRDGLDGVSIPALMKEVGLTHGGFYGHFRDRDELVVEALRFAATETGDGVFGAPAEGLDPALETYLSEGHVARPELGCVLAALGTDAGRQRPAVRAAFADAARGFLRLVERARARRSGAPRTQPSDAALETAARMVGAVVLARLVDDPALAGRILAAARRPRT